ncbi:hypothetical protein [Sulfurospirillum halorespirans]|uniref:Uncharacterized protein n=1 Tax=Sulfurospirillum halorespirans DSM 13726 TaxID=1193502 RepID=A0A1D7TKW7_9BACT|nr:hypothetical protein [Sulfurospirillum halorespirans]AOO65600.1 hypothetical protein SHALO_1829 [Sulfurospirillum halorespirans DSM 13726]
MSELTIRRRPKLFTIWLWMNIIFSVIGGIVYFIYPQLIMLTNPKFSITSSYLYGVMCILSLYFTILILRWKRSGFFGSMALLIVGTGLNLYYVEFQAALVGIILEMITVAYLFLGGSKRLWNYFE